jgi:SH3 domain-containing YSC84-like protein 1
MKKTMAVVLMGLPGLFGTLAWAGTARQDSVDRLESSVDVLHAVMGAPDKGIPEEVLSNAKCILVVPNLINGIHFRRKTRTGSGFVPYL